MGNLRKKIKNSPFLYGLGKTVKEYTLWLFDKVTLHWSEKRRFFQHLGYRLNLKNPRSFNEKLVWKKINDRNPLLVQTSDKHAVRSYIQETLGEKRAAAVLVPLLQVVESAQDIAFEELPTDYIIKINHTSGRNIIIRDGQVNKGKVIAECQRWLNAPYGLSKLEWAYKHIERKVVVEKLLLDKQGNLPNDYKFHIFHGRCRLIQIDLDRQSDHKRSLFTPDWQFLNLSIKYQRGHQIDRPTNLQEMISLAEELARPFDYVRIDLYNLEGKIYFGEFTHYHGSGMERFLPDSFDFELGQHWQIEPKYWLKQNE